MPQKPTFGKRSSFDRCRFPRYADGWLGHETADIVKRRQERFNFAAHRFVGTANFVEKLRSLIGSVLQRGIKNFFYLLPLFVCHFFGCFYSAPQFAMQPGPCYIPISRRRRPRDLQSFRCLFQTQTAKVSKFDKPDLLFVDLRQTI